MSEPAYIIGFDMGAGPDVTVVCFYEDGKLVRTAKWEELTETEKKLVEEKGYHG